MAANNPVRHNGQVIPPSRLVLLGVQHVSRGSLQPEIGLLPL